MFQLICVWSKAEMKNLQLCPTESVFSYFPTVISFQLDDFHVTKNAKNTYVVAHDVFIILYIFPIVLYKTIDQILPNKVHVHNVYTCNT